MTFTKLLNSPKETYQQKKGIVLWKGYFIFISTSINVGIYLRKWITLIVSLSVFQLIVRNHRLETFPYIHRE